MPTQILLSRALDENGDVVAGAEARFFESGTTTPITVYSDTGLANALSVPLQADSAGAFRQVFYDGATAAKVQVTQPGYGADLPEYPLDPAPTISITNSAASNVSFSPTVENPSTNVQTAIQYNAEQRYNRSADVKDMLAAASDAEIRTRIGVGEFGVTARFITDWDAAITDGTVRCLDTATNGPVSDFLRGIVISNTAGTTITQIAWDDSGLSYSRTYASGVWGGWISSGGLGVNQTWQDVSGSRAVSTSYQNTTGRPIMIYINAAAANEKIQVSTDNATWVAVGFLGTSGSYGTSSQIIVPNNHYYRVNGGSFTEWSELR